MIKSIDKMNNEPGLIQGGYHQDERGNLSYFNDFDLTPIKRFYIIEHPTTEVVRAWQAHQKEQKWFYVVAGSFKIVIVQPDDWENPSPDLVTKEFILSSNNNQVLYVPGYFANGFKALEPYSKILVFSNFTVEESSNDNFRYNNNMWYNWFEV